MKVLLIVLVALIFVYFIVQMNQAKTQAATTPTLASTVAGIKSALGIS